MNSYDFLYFGAHVGHLRAQIAAWCEEYGCRLETTPLIAGARFRISGHEDTIREAIRKVRTWIRIAA
jgi:hypothetical protein